MKILLASLLISQALSISLDGGSGIVGVETIVPRGSGREMQDDFTCAVLIAEVEAALNKYYSLPFVCDCSTDNGGYDGICRMLGNTCCGSLCGSISVRKLWNSDFLPQWQYGCITYTSENSGQGVSGKEVCTTLLYSGFDATSCTAAVDGVSCNACNFCDNLYASPDCSNVPGMESFNYGCEDFATAFEVAALICPSSTTGNSNGGGTNGGNPTESPLSSPPNGGSSTEMKARTEEKSPMVVILKIRKALTEANRITLIP